MAVALAAGGLQMATWLQSCKGLLASFRFSTLRLQGLRVHPDLFDQKSRVREGSNRVASASLKYFCSAFVALMFNCTDCGRAIFFLPECSCVRARVAQPIKANLRMGRTKPTYVVYLW